VANPFAEAVLSGQLLLALPIALLAGLVSFASPCVLPLVPGYLGYIGGFASAPDASGRARGRGRLLLGVALFVLGFSLVFVAYGAAFGAVGAWLTTWQDLITRILGAIVIVLGLVFVGQFTFLQRTFKPSWTPATGLAGAPLLGLVFGIGLGVPFLLVALGFSWVTGSVAFLKRHIRIVNIIGGALLVLVGVLMVSGIWTIVMNNLQGVMFSYVTPV
jgi:cytochrome c-type biogenesis protein